MPDPSIRLFAALDRVLDFLEDFELESMIEAGLWDREGVDEFVEAHTGLLRARKEMDRG